MPPLRPAGARGFGPQFWSDNYDQPQLMDGVFNAAEHARYIRASFEVLGTIPNSVADFGFGTGHMLAAVVRELKPYKIGGIEPSAVVFSSGKALIEQAAAPTNSALTQTDLSSWCELNDHARHRYQLGLCMSVLQYLNDGELQQVLPVLARRLKWLYLTVPTAEEARWMKAREGFDDAYAIERTQAELREWLRPHFEPVSARILESRVTLEASDSPFTDHLFRGW